LTTAAVELSTPVDAADPVTDQRLENIDNRVTRLEGLLDNKVLLDMLQRMDELQRELQATRDAADLIGHELESIRERQRELYLDIDQRLRTLEAVISEPATARAKPMPSAAERPDAVTAPPPSPAIDGQIAAEQPGAAPPGPRASDTEAYRDAFNLLTSGRYGEAITAFNQFLTDYPQSSYGGNAQYWLAEANYVSGDYARAAEEFNKVIEQYPDSPKVPDAKLKLGFTHYELQQWQAARTVLSEINQEYPNTSVAQLAENRLERMDREGH
jgi:tol-pal system protein YbgF